MRSKGDGETRNAAYLSTCHDLVDRSPAADVERAKCKADMRYFYEHVLAQEVRDRRTGTVQMQGLGRLHDYLIDFLTFELESAPSHSPLRAYLPMRDENMQFKERWMYFEDLYSPPQIQDGPDGPISQMYYRSETPWMGMIVRIKGDGLDKTVLCPRGHLKSTLCNVVYGLWTIINDPESRSMVLSHTSTLAVAFISEMKWHFAHNSKFQRLFGDLGPPPNKRGAWNAESFNVKTRYGWKSEGKEPTVWALGVGSDKAGGHFSSMRFDDIVGPKNTATADLIAKSNIHAEQMEAVRDPDTPLLNIGTRWAEEDVHGKYTSKDSDHSFICCTVWTASGKPMYPEKFSPRAIQRIREKMSDRQFGAQYLNQYAGSNARVFSERWVKRYPGRPAEFAHEKRLNILIGIDTASGEANSQGDLDYTACFVMGQTQERDKYYFLDGICERLSSDDIAVAIVDLYLRWKDLKHSSASILIGCEETRYTTFLGTALRYVQSQKGIHSYFNVIPLKHKNVAKGERIRVLANPYRDGRIFWPEEDLLVPSVSSKKGPLINISAILADQFRGYPGIVHEDFLDAHAFAYSMSRPVEFPGESAQATLARDPSILTREESLTLHDDETQETYGEGPWLG